MLIRINSHYIFNYLMRHTYVNIYLEGDANNYIQTLTSQYSDDSEWLYTYVCTWILLHIKGGSIHPQIFPIFNRLPQNIFLSN